MIDIYHTKIRHVATGTIFEDAKAVELYLRTNGVPNATRHSIATGALFNENLDDGAKLYKRYGHSWKFVHE